jgi:hypothetical protein
LLWVYFYFLRALGLARALDLGDSEVDGLQWTNPRHQSRVYNVSLDLGAGAAELARNLSFSEPPSQPD